MKRSTKNSTRDIQIPVWPTGIRVTFIFHNAYRPEARRPHAQESKSTRAVAQPYRMPTLHGLQPGSLHPLHFTEATLSLVLRSNPDKRQPSTPLTAAHLLARHAYGPGAPHARPLNQFPSLAHSPPPPLRPTYHAHLRTFLTVDQRGQLRARTLRHMHHTCSPDIVGHRPHAACDDVSMQILSCSRALVNCQRAPARAPWQESSGGASGLRGARP